MKKIKRRLVPQIGELLYLSPPSKLAPKKQSDRLGKVLLVEGNSIHIQYDKHVRVIPLESTLWRYALRFRNEGDKRRANKIFKGRMPLHAQEDTEIEQQESSAEDCSEIQESEPPVTRSVTHVVRNAPVNNSSFNSNHIQVKKVTNMNSREPLTAHYQDREYTLEEWNSFVFERAKDTTDATQDNTAIIRQQILDQLNEVVDGEPTDEDYSAYYCLDADAHHHDEILDNTHNRKQSDPTKIHNKASRVPQQVSNDIKEFPVLPSTYSSQTHDRLKEQYVLSHLNQEESSSGKSHYLEAGFAYSILNQYNGEVKLVDGPCQYLLESFEVISGRVLKSNQKPVPPFVLTTDNEYSYSMDRERERKLLASLSADWR